ncbi:MAG: DUF58 domain-containing protein [Planctomycetales bacterium]|nr:DUF58 domain-containing protein [Planctomycetales bacterium]
MSFLLDAADSIVANPVLLLLLLASPALVSSVLFRITPSLLLVSLLIVPSLLAVTVVFWPAMYVVVLVIDAVIVLFALADWTTIPNPNDFQVERTCQRVASLGKKHTVELFVSNLSTKEIAVVIRDGVPEEFEITPPQFDVSLRPRSRMVFHYDLRSSRRGAFDIDGVHIRTRSRFGCWYRLVKIPILTDVHVYPDMKQLSEYALLARTNRLSLLGVRRTRRVGQDNDFERLRDYTLDDNYKNIDWRSTARRNKLTVKDFQTSQSQRIIFLVDSGRMMTNISSGVTLLDHALNSMLMLSYIALERGDSVGLITFSHQIHSFVPARSGRSHMNQLLHASFDRFPELVESRYDEAFLHLNSHCRKRSLVILITNIIDEVNSQQIQRHLSAITKRHLPIGVFLRDRQLFDAVNLPSEASTDLYRSGAAAEILSWRRQVISDLEHRGVLSLDVFSEALTAPLINKYLEIKARNML